MLEFHTDFVYTDRETKARFVYEKYKQILKGKILDVGADQLYLREYLPEDVEYIGIGLSDHKDIIQIDLEKDTIPYVENSYDCVLCLDVLEHLENIHDVFDQLCKITKNWLILLIPNPWNDLFNCFQLGKYHNDRYLKFYGLPFEREFDRHKWFFSSSEASEFVKYKAKINNMEIIDLYTLGQDNITAIKSITNKLKYLLLKISGSAFINPEIKITDFYEGASWWLLKKKNSDIT